MSKASKITYTAAFAATATALMYIEFPLPFMPPFLKVDLSGAVVLIGAFIFGNPENYVSRGFQNASHFSVNLSASNTYPVALLVRELVPGVLKGKKWIYRESPLFEPPFFQPDSVQAMDFDSTFSPLPKEYRPSQELFYIYSHGRITLPD